VITARDGNPLKKHRADQLQGCAQGSVEKAELAAVAGAIEAYEAKRWPEGRVTGGKG
jgi:hypothetical protein